MFVDYIVLARTFVTLGPPRGCGTVRGGRRGGGGRPRGVRGADPATVTEGAGPGPRRHPKNAPGEREFAAKSKTARRFVTLGPPRGGGLSAAAGAGAPAQGGPGSRIRHRHRGGGARNGPRRPPRNAFGPAGICG